MNYVFLIMIGLLFSLTHSLTHSFIHVLFILSFRPSNEIRVYFSIESHEERKFDKSKQKKGNNEKSGKFSVPTVAEDLKATEIALTEIINEFEFARQQGNSFSH